MKKILLMIVIAALLAGCDSGYGRHPEVMAAMRDPLFDQWLERNNLELLSTYRCIGCTRLHVRFVDEKNGVK